MTQIGILLVALLAAGALLAPTSRVRALAMLGALGLTPTLLLMEIWDSPQVRALGDRPLVLAVGVVLAAVVVAGLARLFAVRPTVLGVLAVLALPFRAPIEVGGSSANLLVPLYLVIGAGALAWIVPRLRRGPALDPPLGNGWLERLLAATVVLYAIQAAWSADAEKALEQAVFFYVPFTLLFALLRELDWGPLLRRRAFIGIAALAVVFVLVGFVEYQQRTLLLNPKVIASNQVGDAFRVNSLFFDPNIYGRFLATVMIAAAAVLLWTRERRAVLSVTALLVVLWAGLLLTLSQSSFTALLVGLVVLAALRWSARVTFGAAGLVAVAALLAVLAFPSALRLDLSSGEGLRRATSGRSELMRGGVSLALDRPVAGWGSASFSREFRRHEDASSEQAVSASHTIPITVAAEQGLIGLALYLALLGTVLARLWRRAERDVARAAVVAAFAGLVVHSWLYAAFLEDPLTWTLLAVGVALGQRPPRTGSAPGPTPGVEVPGQPALREAAVGEVPVIPRGPERRDDDDAGLTTPPAQG